MAFKHMEINQTKHIQVDLNCGHKLEHSFFFGGGSYKSACAKGGEHPEAPNHHCCLRLQKAPSLQKRDLHHNNQAEFQTWIGA